MTRRNLFFNTRLMNIDQITGVILAGGRGSRMGGVDKGLQIFRGTPMVLHVMKRLLPQVGQLAVNANQNLPLYREFGVPVWTDDLPDFPGPLAGLHASLGQCGTAFLLTVPCDSPFLPLDLVGKLTEALEAHGADLAFAITGAGASRQPQPVFCLLKTSLLPDLERYLQGGGRKVETWYASLHAVEVPFGDESAFRNINTLDELRRFEAE